MKRRIIFLALIFPLLIQAQDGTTLEEYRYLTKGFAYQIEMGLDTKKEGYTLQTLYTTKNDVEFVGLIENATQNLKGMSAILNPKMQQPTFICLPSPSTPNDILEIYYKDKAALMPVYQMQLDAAMREWQYVQLGMEVGLPDVMEVTEINEPNNEFTSKGLEAIPEEYNIPAVDPTTLKIIKKPPLKMKTANVELSNNLNDRTFVQAPAVEDRYLGTGKVAVKVCIDSEGHVHYARYTLKGSTSMDAVLKEVAVESAKNTKFSSSANKEQCGVLTYEFK